MNIYDIEKRFDPKTGEPTRPESDLVEVRCDYSGKVIADYSEDGNGKILSKFPGVRYAFQLGDVAYPMFKEYPIDRHMFFASNEYAGPYDICYPLLDKATEEFAHQVLDDSSPSVTWDEFLIQARFETAKKLLDNEVIRPYQLHGYARELPTSREAYEKRVEEEGEW